MGFLTSNWEWVLLAMYVVEKVVKLSPSKKDDVIFDMILKPIIDKVKGKQVAKQVLNIVDFSGGINKAVDKRDLEANELVLSDGLISYEPGKLTLNGTFNTLGEFEQAYGSFSENYISEGIPNLYGYFPEVSFLATSVLFNIINGRISEPF